MADHSINILITGGGAPGAAGVIRCLRELTSIKIIVADARKEVAGTFLGDVFTQVPKAEDPLFIDTIINICAKERIDLLLPLVTKELLPLAISRAKIERTGATLLLSSADSLEIANDKGKLYQFLQWRGIPVPAYQIIDNLHDFDNAVLELGYPGKTIVCKPCFSNGSRGVRILTPMIDKQDLLFNYKPGSLLTTLAEFRDILVDGIFPPLLISEYLPGDEYSVDCVADNGSSLLIVPRLRIKMLGGITIEGEFIENDFIINYCKKMIEELRLDGNIGIQVKQDINGEFRLLEINPRVQGTISAALGAGVNLPVLAIKQKLSMAIYPRELDVRWGTKFIRIWNEIYY